MVAVKFSISDSLLEQLDDVLLWLSQQRRGSPPLDNSAYYREVLRAYCLMSVEAIERYKKDKTLGGQPVNLNLDPLDEAFYKTEKGLQPNSKRAVLIIGSLQEELLRNALTFEWAVNRDFLKGPNTLINVAYLVERVIQEDIIQRIKALTEDRLKKEEAALTGTGEEELKEETAKSEPKPKSKTTTPAETQEKLAADAKKVQDTKKPPK